MGVGRGFLGEGAGGSVGGGALLGLGAIGGGLAAGFGTTAGLSSLLTVLAICCCLSLCFSHAGLLSSPLSPLATFTGDFERGGESDDGSHTSFCCSPCICFLFRKNSGSSSSGASTGGFFLTQEGGELVSLLVSTVGGRTLDVLRNWLAQGATCAFSSSFFSNILFSKSVKAELLPVLCRAFFRISDISKPPPLLAFGLGCVGLAVFIVAPFPEGGLAVLAWFTGMVAPLEVRAVAAERVGSGGAACFCNAWVGLMVGMGVVGRGGGEEGTLSTNAASGRSS